MEEHINSFENRKPHLPVRQKKKKLTKRTCVIIAIVFIFIIVISLIIRHKQWLEFKEKYYDAFLEKHHITQNDFDTVSNSVHKHINLSGRDFTLTFNPPLKDNFVFGVSLVGRENDYNEYFTVSFNENYYDYEVLCRIEKGGKREYHVWLNSHAPGSQMADGLISATIENDTLKESDGSPKLSEEDRKVLRELKPQILEIKEIIDNEVLDGLE